MVVLRCTQGQACALCGSPITQAYDLVENGAVYCSEECAQVIGDIVLKEILGQTSESK